MWVETVFFDRRRLLIAVGDRPLITGASPGRCWIDIAPLSCESHVGNRGH